MRAFRLLLLDATVVAAGLFAYDRLVPPPRGSDDPLAASTLERLEAQAEALRRRPRKDPDAGTVSMGIPEMVRALDLGLPEEDRERLVAACEGFQAERIRFWSDPATHDLGEDDYARAYRALVARYEAEVRALVTDPRRQAEVIRLFIGDGRVIRRTIR